MVIRSRTTVLWAVVMHYGATADGSKQLVYGGVAQWEVLVQLDLLSSSGALTSHVFGLGIDDEVSYTIENLTTPEDFWTHRDEQGTLTSNKGLLDLRGLTHQILAEVSSWHSNSS